MDLLDFFNVNGGAIQGFSTLVLVFITSYYAWQTRKMTLQMMLQREDEMLPIVVLGSFNNIHEADNPTDYCIHCRIRNIGNGPALNLLVRFYDTNNKSLVAQSKDKIDFLERGVSEETTIHMPISSFGEIDYRQDKKGRFSALLIGEVEFVNFRGRAFSASQELTLYKDIMEILPIKGSYKFNSGSTNG
ncbi:MAG TPA: hypothetical protein DCX45_12745 [Acinetobacter junii]|nr:hypothetical protein [Acinetobacter junii]